jgi:hypothetical protein
VHSLNEVYSSLSQRRRYEVWFLRLGLADGSGAWWLRYLLSNPGRSGCAGETRVDPVQVWATWFPRGAAPQSFIQGFPVQQLQLIARGQSPFHLRVGKNFMDEDSCRGELEQDGHRIAWDLRWQSRFHVTLSSKGWIGFSRSPHSDAVFSGSITLDGRTAAADRLGFGVQGHNCGYRHRGYWRWAHAYFPASDGGASTLEVLVYDMPFGLVFRKAVLWHHGKATVFRALKESPVSHDSFAWSFRGRAPSGMQMEASFDGGQGRVHRASYVKTNCSGSFPVLNNSLARATLRLQKNGGEVETLETTTGAVLEMGGDQARRMTAPGPVARP